MYKMCLWAVENHTRLTYPTFAFTTTSFKWIPSIQPQKLSIYRAHSTRNCGPLSWHPAMTRGVRARLMYRWFDFTTSCSVTASPPLSPSLPTPLIHSVFQSNTLSRNFCGPRDCFHICEGKLNMLGGMTRSYIAFAPSTSSCSLSCSPSCLVCARFSV